MTAIGEHYWHYGIRCDHPGCKATIWRQGSSEQLAFTAVQADAQSAGWRVAQDRLHASRDMCPEHAKTVIVAYAAPFPLTTR